MKKWLIALLLVGILVSGVVGTAQAVAVQKGGSIPAGQTVDDDAILSGNNIQVDGTVNGTLMAGGITVTITGTVNGDAILAAGPGSGVAGLTGRHPLPRLVGHLRHCLSRSRCHLVRLAQQINKPAAFIFQTYDSSPEPIPSGFHLVSSALRRWVPPPRTCRSSKFCGLMNMASPSSRLVRPSWPGSGLLFWQKGQVLGS